MIWDVSSGENERSTRRLESPSEARIVPSAPRLSFSKPEEKITRADDSHKESNSETRSLLNRVESKREEMHGSRFTLRRKDLEALIRGDIDSFYIRRFGDSVRRKDRRKRHVEKSQRRRKKRTKRNDSISLLRASPIASPTAKEDQATGGQTRFLFLSLLS